MDETRALSMSLRREVAGMLMGEPRAETYMDVAGDEENPRSHGAGSAEHVTSEGRKVTCSGNDTRERLEADVWIVAYEIYKAGGYVNDGSEPNPPTNGILTLLDRQAAITGRELVEAREAVRRLQERCAEEKANADGHWSNANKWKAELSNAIAERDKLRAENERLRRELVERRPR